MAVIVERLKSWIKAGSVPCALVAETFKAFEGIYGMTDVLIDLQVTSNSGCVQNCHINHRGYQGRNQRSKLGAYPELFGPEARDSVAVILDHLFRGWHEFLVLLTKETLIRAILVLETVDQ